MPFIMNEAVQIALTTYTALVVESGFTRDKLHTDRQQEYTYQEQLALTEQLIRAWAYTELDQLIRRFKVVAVEREIANHLTDSIILLTRVDAELQDRQDDSFFNYSLKTTKWFDERSYKHDLQGPMEIWGVENHIYESNQGIHNVLDAIERCNDSFIRIPKMEDIKKYYQSKRQQPKKVSGVKFCYLVKGRWEQDDKFDENSLWKTKSPLIRGYKNITPSGVEYAHTLYYPNSENKSGKGRLGKGWEPFDVWTEQGITLDSWCQALLNQTIQPECGDVLRNEVVRTPIEYFRSEEEINRVINEVGHQESRIANANPPERMLNIVFPRYYHSCHYPYDCSYIPICWKESEKGDISEDPIGSGLYQIRTPHHEGEK